MSENEMVERLRVALEGAFRAPKSVAKRKRTGPPRRTSAEAMMLLGSARRPARPRASSGAGATVLRLDGEIGWDVTAQDLVDQLQGASGVELHVNSPGGDVWEGIAMYNAIKDHPGTVTVIVDGIAASAASFLAMAGDRIVMNRSSQLMIHDAWTVTAGDEAEHLRTAELLGRVSSTIAGIYARRAGGTVDEWRAAMRAETWYSPEEAVTAGLADEAVQDAADLADVIAASFRAASFRAAIRAALL